MKSTFIDTLSTYRSQDDKLFGDDIKPMVTGTFVIWKNKNIFNVSTLNKLKTESSIPIHRVEDIEFIIKESRFHDLEDVRSITIFDQTDGTTKIWIRIERWFHQHHTMEQLAKLKDMYIHYDVDTIKFQRSWEKSMTKLLLGGIIVLLMSPFYIYCKK